MPESILNVEIGFDTTSDDILDQMRIMMSAREEKRYGHIVCKVRGPEHDPRESWEIPEVRSVCGRLVSLGFISYLDKGTVSLPDCIPALKGAWGAAEVWLTSLGHQPGKQLPFDLFDALKGTLNASDDMAEKLLGAWPTWSDPAGGSR